MDDLHLLLDLHRSQARQGPGGEVETLRAAGLAGLDRSRPLRIADVGCGTGAAALVLARELDARVVAVDLHPQFLAVLASRTRRRGLAGRICPVAASMDALPFADSTFDVIWSEGAVYNVGFEAGVAAWRRFLRPGGTLVVSEITWLTAERPAEIEEFWNREYPEMGTAADKTAALERTGYTPVGSFVLPEHCWTDHYYRPLQAGFDAFLRRHGDSPRARALVEAEQGEIALYERFGRHYGYGMYVARAPRGAANHP